MPLVRQLRGGDFSFKYELRKGCLTEIDFGHLKQVIESGQTLTKRQVAIKLGHARVSIHYAFKPLCF